MTEISDVTMRSKLLQTVQAVVDKYQPRKYRLSAVDIFQDDDWYHVVVESSSEKRDNEFYDSLTSAEEELATIDHDHHFLLVPVIAD